MTTTKELIDALVDYAENDTEVSGQYDFILKVKSYIESLSAEVERLTDAYDKLLNGPLCKKEYEELSYNLQQERDVEALARDKAEAERDQLRTQIEAQGEAVFTYKGQGGQDLAETLEGFNFGTAFYTHPAPAAPVVEMLQGYADSYKLMAKMGDGKVLAGNVAVDIERNMIHAAIHLIQPKGEKA